jgi:uncharacterized protein YjiS (DUF1127 family)
MSYQTCIAAENRVTRPGWRTALATALLLRCLTALRGMHERWCQRTDLRELDDRLLRDIGITREQARREVRKPFWR